jgi:hypothetical protein
MPTTIRPRRTRHLIITCIIIYCVQVAVQLHATFTVDVWTCPSVMIISVTVTMDTREETVSKVRFWWNKQFSSSTRKTNKVRYSFSVLSRPIVYCLHIFCTRGGICSIYIINEKLYREMHTHGSFLLVMISNTDMVVIIQSIIRLHL